MQQLHLQSLFSFRRLAPADDYLGSPFSASLRPLLLGFPLRFPVASSFFRSLPFRFRFPFARFRILSFLFFLSALRRFRLPVAFPTPCASLSVRSGFPLPCRLVSRSSSPVPLIQLSCSFPFALPCFAPTAVPQVLPFSSAFYSFLSRICPCVRSLRFHPAFTVLPLRSRPFRTFATWPLFLPFPSSTFRLTGAFRVPSALSASSRPLPSLHFPPLPFLHARSLSGPSVPVVLRSRYSVPLLFLSPPHGSPHSGSPCCLPSLSGSGLPLSFFLPGVSTLPTFLGFASTVSRFVFRLVRLRFGLLGIMIHPEN